MLKNLKANIAGQLYFLLSFLVLKQKNPSYVVYLIVLIQIF